jgi:succinate dehydrogenase / fumarate reductase cytochrome b subunit
VDFWSKGTKYQNVMFWIAIVISFVSVAAFAPVHLARVFGAH